MSDFDLPQPPPSLPILAQSEGGDVDVPEEVGVPEAVEVAPSIAVDEPHDSLVLARATINMPGGIHAGNEYWVDPAALYVRTALAAGFFTPVAELPAP